MTVTHVYRMKARQHIVGLAVLVIGVPLASVLTERLFDAGAPRFFKVVAPVVYALGGILLTIRAFGTSVRLSDTEIELRTWTGSIVLPLNRIEGRRRYLDKGDEHSPSVWHLVLQPNDDRFPKLDIEELYRFDDFFYRWFNSLPDLDEADKRRPKTSNFGLI
jgi:hypothetical protein